MNNSQHDLITIINYTEERGRGEKMEGRRGWRERRGEGREMLSQLKLGK